VGRQIGDHIAVSPPPHKSRPLVDQKRHAKGEGRGKMAGGAQALRWKKCTGGKGLQEAAGVCDPSGSPGYEHSSKSREGRENEKSHVKGQSGAEITN